MIPQGTVRHPTPVTMNDTNDDATDDNSIDIESVDDISELADSPNEPIHEQLRQIADLIEQDDEPPCVGAVVLAGYSDDGSCWRFDTHIGDDERFLDGTDNINDALNIIRQYHLGLASATFGVGMDDVDDEMVEMPSLGDLLGGMGGEMR